MPRVGSCRFVPGALLRLCGSCRCVSKSVCVSRGSCHACRKFVCVSCVSGSVRLTVFLCVSACHARRMSRVSRVMRVKIIACHACRVSCVSGSVSSCVFAVRVCFCASLSIKSYIWVWGLALPPGEISHAPTLPGRYSPYGHWGLHGLFFQRCEAPPGAPGRPRKATATLCRAAARPGAIAYRLPRFFGSWYRAALK
jgi:hypothetical protein